MNGVLIATVLVGYVVSAVVCYLWAAKTAVEAEDNKATMPARVVLTVVEGGQNDASDYQSAA